MAQHQLIGTIALEVEVDVETHPIGPHVVEGGINHAAGQGIDLDFAGTEVMAHRAGEGHMQRTLAEVVIEARLIGITDRNPRHPREDIASLNLPEPPEVGASWS